MKHRNKSLRWGYLLFIASLAAIIFATISPFNFQIPAGFSGQFILQEFKFASSVKDYWQNILLFMPLGIGLAMMFAPKQLSTSAILIVVCLASILISSAVEITQFCLPSRVSNVTDIICNSLGGTLGGILYFWRSQIIQLLIGIVCRDFERLSLKSLLRAIACYCFLVMVLIWALAVNVNLSNWDDNFHLTIGNEVTGDRPWNGQISDLYISDRGLNPSEVQQIFKAADVFLAQSSDLVTSIKFANGKNYYQDRSHHLAHLVWQGLSASSQIEPINQSAENTGILVNSKQWLQTTKPAVALHQKLKNTGEFSLYLAVSSNDPQQFGPARIVTLSEGVNSQNLVIGQKGKDLKFRLRSPITGRNATQPSFLVPRVFEHQDLCQILVIFAHKKLDFYVNNPQNKYSFEFTPANSFLSYLPWERKNWIINLEKFQPVKAQMLFYTIIMIPLIVLAGYLLVLLRRTQNQ
jgi:glycopeptide antibiotics resistance protein